MPDCFWAKIAIGGDLRKSQVREFWEVAVDDPLPREDDPTQEDIDELVKGIEDSLTQIPDDAIVKLFPEGVLVLDDPDVPDGEFTELEKTCRACGLSYIRQTEAGPEWEAYIEWWQPGMEAPDYRNCDQYGRPIINGEKLAKLVGPRKQTLQRHSQLLGPESKVDAGSSNHMKNRVIDAGISIWESLSGLIQDLEAQVAPSIELAPLRIVDD